MGRKLSFFTCLFLTIGKYCALKDSDYDKMPDLYGLDDYDSCIQEEKGVYCVAKFDLFADPRNDVINLIKDYSMDIKHYNYSNIDRGICVTKSCREYVISNDIEKDEDVKSVLERCFNEIIWKDYKINASLSLLYHCDRYGELIQIDIVDWIVASVFAVLTALVLFASYYDFKLRKIKKISNTTSRSNDKFREMDVTPFVKSAGNKYLLCFSMFENIQILTRSQGDPRLDSLKELHGARTVVIGIIVFAHMVLLICVFSEDPNTFEKAYDSAVYYLIFNGMMVVQVFFFLSGFMLAYFLQLNAEKYRIGWTTIPKIIIIRWWRLTPACAAMVAVMASWVRHAGAGPLWKLATTNSTTSDCRRYWWTHLLYINNYVIDNKRCLFQTWHTAADMQMFILGLLVHVATRSAGRLRALLLLVTVGMLAPAVSVWLYGYDAFHMLIPEYLRNLSGDTFYYVHNRGYMNLPCFLLGMASGYLGYSLQARGTDLSSCKILRFLSWWVIPLFMGVIYSGRSFYYELRGSVLARMAYAATHRMALGLLFSAWILGMICRCNEASRRLFAWRGWAVTSRLSYCVFLFHNVFYHMLLGLRRHLMPVSFAYIALITAGVLVLSYIAAVPMYLMIEAPFYRLTKVILQDPGFEGKENGINGNVGVNEATSPATGTSKRLKHD